jgi:hypothetical protein
MAAKHPQHQLVSLATRNALRKQWCKTTHNANEHHRVTLTPPHVRSTSHVEKSAVRKEGHVKTPARKHRHTQPRLAHTHMLSAPTTKCQSRRGGRTMQHRTMRTFPLAVHVGLHKQPSDLAAARIAAEAGSLANPQLNQPHS